jgi:hypothetical protein
MTWQLFYKTCKLQALPAVLLGKNRIYLIRIMYLVRKTKSILCTLRLLFCLETKSNKKIQGCIKIAKIYPIALRRKGYAAAYTHD